MQFFQFDGMHFILFGAERVIRWYGILLMLGAVAGSWLATKSAKRRGHDPEIVWDLLTYLLVGGIIGARLWHVFTPSPSALVLDPATGEMVNPYFAGGTIRILDILSVWNGGLGIPGAVIGGAVVLFFYTRKRRLSFTEWADIAAPSIPLGQAIGRWGNFFNQELYGARRIFRGRYELMKPIVWRVMSSSNTIIRFFCTNRSSTLRICSSSSGFHAAMRIDSSLVTSSSRIWSRIL